MKLRKNTADGEKIYDIEECLDKIPNIANKVNVSDIVNNLKTNESNKPLSAAQGVIIKSLIDAKPQIQIITWGADD